jgi:hypothetical protein
MLLPMVWVNMSADLANFRLSSVCVNLNVVGVLAVRASVVRRRGDGMEAVVRSAVTRVP